ncbi:MAG: hypothetical protein AAB629_01715, partial [Patescibacteria group bacterium]
IIRTIPAILITRVILVIMTIHRILPMIRTVRTITIIRRHIIHHIHIIPRLIIQATAIRTIHIPHITIIVMGTIITVMTMASTTIVIAMTINAPYIHIQRLIHRMMGVVGEGGNLSAMNKVFPTICTLELLDV